MATIQTPGNACSAQIENPVSGCFRPLSCRECLAIEVGLYYDSTLSISGVTQSVLHVGLPGRRERLLRQRHGSGLDSGLHDRLYTHAIAQNLSLPAAKDDPRLQTRQLWNFPSSQATYCSDGDAVCKSCQNAQFWSPYAVGAFDGRFCVGAGGCVCISSCTHPELWCEVLFRRNPPFSTPPPTLPSSPGASRTPAPPSSLTPSISVSSSPAPTSSDAVSRLPTEDECRYSTQSQTCQRFRPCRDCLTKQGCRVSDAGSCELDAASSDPAYDYRNAFRQNLTLPDAHDRTTNTSALATAQHWRFPALQVSYCPTGDPICQRCTEANFWTGLGSGITPFDSRFCIGLGGCVCIANCPLFDDYIVCETKEQASTKGGIRWGWIVMVVGFVAVIAIAVVVRCMRNKRHRQELSLQNDGVNHDVYREADGPVAIAIPVSTAQT